MCNRYKYNDIKIGVMESFEVEITEENMRKFCELSGDMNPLHNNKKYAKEMGYKDKVVYGMLTSAYYSTLVGMYLPGEKCLLHSIDIGFVSPVYIGDRLIVKGLVKEKNDTFKQLVISATIENQLCQKVSKAKIKVGVLNG